MTSTLEQIDKINDIEWKEWRKQKWFIICHTRPTEQLFQFFDKNIPIEMYIYTES